MSPYLASHQAGMSMEEGHTLIDQSSVWDLEAWNTVGVQKALEDSKGVVTSLGLPNTGSEGTAQGHTWQLEAWPCSMLGERKGRWIAQVSVKHLRFP